jgi:hydrogenase nickel incorporation protein HypA/HybF
MHETMVAKGLLDAIEAEAKKQNARPISAKMSCGSFNAVNDEVLTFAFEAIAHGTICEGLKLKIEHKGIRAKCRKCNCQFDIDFTLPRCSACKSEDYELLPDPPLLLQEVEFETE